MLNAKIAQIRNIRDYKLSALREKKQSFAQLDYNSKQIKDSANRKIKKVKEKARIKNKKRKQRIREKFNKREKQIRKDTRPGKAREGKIKRAETAKKNALEKQQKTYQKSKKSDYPINYQKKGFTRYNYIIEYKTFLAPFGKNPAQVLVDTMTVGNNAPLSESAVFNRFQKYIGSAQIIDLLFNPPAANERPLYKQYPIAEKDKKKGKKKYWATLLESGPYELDARFELKSTYDKKYARMAAAAGKGKVKPIVFSFKIIALNVIAELKAI